jgi:signal transduction histidine kinase
VTVALGFALTISANNGGAHLLAAGILAVHALVRTLIPRPRSERAVVIGVAGELAGTALAVCLTGCWTSPFVFTLFTPLVAAGFSFGFGVAVPLAIAAGATVTAVRVPVTTSDTSLVATGVSELVLVALVAGYGRRIFGQAEARTVTALSRLSQLSRANALLQQLNAVAQTLPASLDLRETVTSTIEQVHALVRPDAVAAFLWDGTLQTWSVGGAIGARLPATIDEAGLPAPVKRASRRALTEPGAFLVDLTTDGPGLTPAARVGIYAPLIARRTLVGVLVAESQDADALHADHLELFSGLAEQAALAIDNAVWFGRLRTVGAEEERMRIARDLHDRVAQGLAYLAFELDRIVDLSAGGELSAPLDSLRDDVRRVVTEVRDALYDLRTDVSDAQDLTATINAFLDRVKARSGLEVTFEHRVTGRLSVPLERELWRITQEAITNVEKHSRARHLAVRWSVGQHQAEVAVIDDGVGFPSGSVGRLDSYGMLGMRERADAIGATLVVDSRPGVGTKVRCRVEVA